MKVSTRIIGVIPARYASTRLPGKPLAVIHGKPMIQRVWERVSQSKYIDLVMVATDDVRISRTVFRFGGEFAMTSAKHKSGTDRIYEAVRDVECDIVVNIQGDEPFINPADIDKAIKPLLVYKDISVSTLCCEIKNKNEIDDPNIVKVIMDNDDNAIYFSRLPVPYKRKKDEKVKYYKHIGLYAFRKSFLARYVKMKQSSLEKAEKLEQLRILENGEKIKVVKTTHDSISIDTKEDLRRINKNNKFK